MPWRQLKLVLLLEVGAEVPAQLEAGPTDMAAEVELLRWVMHRALMRAHQLLGLGQELAVLMTAGNPVFSMRLYVHG